MKLSNLNKFKGNRVCIQLWDDEIKDNREIIGIVEEVNESGITIDWGDGMSKVPIESLKEIGVVEPKGVNAQIQELLKERDQLIEEGTKTRELIKILKRRCRQD